MATSGTTVTAAHAMSLVARLAQMLQLFAEDPGDAAFGPVPDCPALRERSQLPDHLDPLNAYYQAGLLHEVATDNIFAFTKLFHGPVPTIAPWVCIRAALESSAIAGWLADSGIDALERVARSLAFRKEGVLQQRKLAQTQSPKTRSPGIEDRLQRLDCHLAALKEQRPTRRTAAPLTSTMPTTTELVRDILAMEADYRILSALAHAHQWALQQMSFQVIRDAGPLRLERKLEPIVVVYLCTLAARAFLAPLRTMTQQFGWQAPILFRTISMANEIASEPVRIVPTAS